MKDVIKLDRDVQFEVMYSDGSKHHAAEGILFEVNTDNTMTMHFGTDRSEVVMAVCECVVEMLDDIMRKNLGKEKNEEA